MKSNGVFTLHWIISDLDKLSDIRQKNGYDNHWYQKEYWTRSSKFTLHMWPLIHFYLRVYLNLKENRPVQCELTTAYQSLKSEPHQHKQNTWPQPELCSNAQFFFTSLYFLQSLDSVLGWFGPESPGLLSSNILHLQQTTKKNNIKFRKPTHF